MAEADFGSDLAGITDLTPTLEEVSGGRCVAERIARNWLQENGTLWYDKGLGAGLQRQLNAPVVPSRLGPRLRDQAERDECVESARVEVSFIESAKTLEVLGKLELTNGSELSLSLATNGVTAELLMGS